MLLAQPIRVLLVIGHKDANSTITEEITGGAGEFEVRGLFRDRFWYSGCPSAKECELLGCGVLGLELAVVLSVEICVHSKLKFEL